MQHEWHDKQLLCEKSGAQARLVELLVSESLERAAREYMARHSKMSPWKSQASQEQGSEVHQRASGRPQPEGTVLHCTRCPPTRWTMEGLPSEHARPMKKSMTGREPEHDDSEGRMPSRTRVAPSKPLWWNTPIPRKSPRRWCCRGT